MEEALRLEPNNKALQKELSKYQKMQQEQGTKAAATSGTASSSSGKSTSTTTKTTTTTKPTTTTTQSTTPSKPDQVDGEVFTKSEHVKGYKIVNGKKTSYFHNELSEEAKQLIGDIAPKKLDASATYTLSLHDALPIWKSVV